MWVYVCDGILINRYGESVPTGEESFAYDPTKHPSRFSTCQPESQVSTTARRLIAAV